MLPCTVFIMCIFLSYIQLNMCDQINDCQDCESSTEEIKGEIMLFCKDERRMVIFWSRIYEDLVFSVEYRSISNQSWTRGEIVNEPKAVISNLNGGYIFRVTPYNRITNETGKPRESKSFYTLSRTASLSEVRHVTIEVNATYEKHLSAILSWEPVKEKVCGYNIIIWRVGQETYEQSPTVDELYAVVLSNLLYSTEYQIGIHAITDTVEGKKKWTPFITPPCGQEYGNGYTNCAPEKPRDFTVSFESCILTLSWEVPSQLPEFYYLQVQSIPSGALKYFTISGDKSNFTIDTRDFSKDFQITFYAINNSKKGDEIMSSLTNQCILEKWLTNTPGGKKVSKEVFQNQEQLDISVHDLWIGAETGFIALAVVIIVILLVLFLLLSFQTSFHSNPQESNSASKEEDKIDTPKNEDVGQNIPLNKEIESNKLIIQEIVGKGEFGIVSKALMKLPDGDVEVAVKSLRRNATKEDVDCFNAEVEVMRTVGKHRNLVSLVGFCSSDKLLVVEYCALGDLLHFLRETRKVRLMLQDLLNSGNGSSEGQVIHIGPAKFVTNAIYERTDIEKKQLELNTIDLLSFARQIANGMEYLSINKIIHRDLAARNILLTADLTAKISDFGLSRDIYLESVYRKKHISKLPIKWMAPECLSHQLFTTQSDIWSFGVLLWEIMTLGGAPYPFTSSGKIYKLLKSGYRMEKPPSCSQEVYDIMTSCWSDVPYRRPSFSSILKMVDKVLNSNSMHEYIELFPDNSNNMYMNAGQRKSQQRD